MKLLSLSKKISFLFFLIIISDKLYAENEIDIWKKNKSSIGPTKEVQTNTNSLNNKLDIQNKNLKINNLLIEENIKDRPNAKKIYGIYDPDQNNFTLDMWSNTDGEEIQNTIKRISKLKLSNSSKKIFIKTMLTYSYTPKNISEEDFLNLKINWLIKNNETELLEEYLNKNQEFQNKAKVIQYLVDQNIAGANLKEGCEKVNFINKEIKDSYLEKFKIYCLIFNKKNNQAQLLFDILKEQKRSDNFFNEKVNFLLGITEKTNEKIDDTNLLNFYLSSITIKDFKYQPTKKTKKIIWEYLNSANLIQLQDIADLKRIQELELAANSGALKKDKIFEIYRQISFELNSLINAEDIYQTLDGINSRSLIYQKYLLSDNIENKIKLLFILKDLFKKDKLSNLYVEFLSENLKKMKPSEIPDSFREVVAKNILKEEEYKLGKIKYDDKVIHRSRIIRFYTEEGTSKQKSQRDLESVYKKIKRNKKYFFSAKDLALIESLEKDGFKIPKEFNYKEIAKKYSIPGNLLKLAQNNEAGFLALKLVEIIGADEIVDLDPETIYFVTHLLNKLKLYNFRNDLIISGLPLRV
tara:strand:- start:225 stop:1967 length:1743 start_codon:yes stop_codon:yes gene_type:complete